MHTGGRTAVQRVCMRSSRGLHKLCIAVGCLAAYILNAFARRSFNSDRQLFSSRLSPWEAYWGSSQNSRKSYTNQGNSQDLWGLRPTRVSLSSLLLPGPWLCSPSFLRTRAGECDSGNLGNLWLAPRKTEIVLFWQVSQKFLREGPLGLGTHP